MFAEYAKTFLLIDMRPPSCYCFLSGVDCLVLLPQEVSKIPSQQMVTVGIDANEKMGLEKQADTKMDAAKETLLIQMPQKKFAIASAETKSTYNLVCVARNTGDLNQEKRLRRKLCRQLQQDRDNEWTSRANKFEKVWEDKNPRKAYVPLKQYSGKMKRCSPVLSITSGVAVGEAILPIRWNHFKTLLNRKTPSALGLGPICAVNEEIFHLLDTDQNQRPSRYPKDEK
ncbi:hypothetical protein RB195_021754 [Necator americanus]|uniref:Uncharacterized protein n=1 Tax=Necator americanus TaxID=51031 RepID=A0ABR1ECI0_NECAM